MPTEELVSVREYLSSSYDPDCDYVDGVVEERNLGEKDHSSLQMAVAAYFYARRKEWGDASEISVSSLLVIASAKVSKFTICSTKAPGPPITLSR